MAKINPFFSYIEMRRAFLYKSKSATPKSATPKSATPKVFTFFKKKN